MAVCKRFKQFMLGALNESEQSHARHQGSIRIYQLRCLEYFSHWVVTLLPAVGIGLRERKVDIFFCMGGSKVASPFSREVPPTRAKAPFLQEFYSSGTTEKEENHCLQCYAV